MLVSKTDAALQQLAAAVRLWEHGVDMIAAHTLTCAALELVRGMVRASGGDLLLDEALKAHVRPDGVKVVNTAMRGAQNFFKHADRDPQGTFDFQPETTEWLMFMTVLGMRQLGVTLPAEISAFQAYVAVLNHEVLVMEPDQRRGAENLRRSLPGKNKGETLKMLRGLIESGAWRTA